jgi:hypothetical protein
MDGMLQHGLRNVAESGCLYTCDKEDATGVFGPSATPLFDPQAYMELESRFTLQRKDYTIVGNAVSAFPEQFTTHPIDDRI